MTLTGLLTFTAVYGVAVASPGPGVALIIARGLARGLNYGAAFLLGFALGDLVWYAVAANGLAALARVYEGAFTLFRYAGCLYLVYVAWQIWNAPTDIHMRRDETGDGPIGAFMSSFLLTIGNPKPIVFFLSIMPLVVDLRTLTLAEFLQLGLVVLVVIVMITGGYLALAARARDFLTSEAAVRRMNRITASMMLLAAFLVVWKG